MFVLLLTPAGAGAVPLGAAINDAGFQVEEYRETFLEHHDAATAESAMKMTALQPSEGDFEFGQADAIVDWARANGKEVHGHVLVWCADEWNPDWVVSGDWTREELLAVMEEYIETVVDHFEGRVETWDVVNEPFNPDGTRRDCVWQRAIGDDWVEQAFAFARAADPDVSLFLNEYQAERPGSRKYRAVLDLAGSLPNVDGVGLQHHTYGYAPMQYEIEDSIARIGALGKEVHLSELNVPTVLIPGTTAEKLAQQAQAYATVASACAAQPACFRVTTWGFTDAFGWRPPPEMAMPFDTDYAPKRAWGALERALGRVEAPATAPPPAPATHAPYYEEGLFTVTWQDVGDATYTLQHRAEPDGEWRTLATGIPHPSFTFADWRRERKGSWTYRVRADAGAWSEPSAPVFVALDPPPDPLMVDEPAPVPPVETVIEPPPPPPVFVEPIAPPVVAPPPVRPPLMLFTSRARIRHAGTLRLRVGCRRSAPVDCRSALRMRSARSRSVLIRRGATRTVVVRRLRASGRVAVYAGVDRLGVVQVLRKRSSSHSARARTRSIG